ncbi:translation initiation factor IF-1, chloroplastic [Fagus crenata]
MLNSLSFTPSPTLLPKIPLSSTCHSHSLKPHKFPHPLFTKTPTSTFLAKISQLGHRTPPKAEEQKWTHEGSITSHSPTACSSSLDNQDLILGYISSKIPKNFIQYIALEIESKLKSLAITPHLVQARSD